MRQILIRDIEGIKIGNAQNIEAATGCTVVICEKGATAGVDVRGGAPGTRETDLLNPVNLVDKVHGILLSGGSAFGLDAASGVMQFLEERNIGFDVGVTKVPIVPAAVIFDLVIGSHQIRPDKDMGYTACMNAEDMYTIKNFKEDGYDYNSMKNHYYIYGNIGAGTGATIGKILGPSSAMKGGLGSYCIQVGDLKIGAIVSVNCLGDIVDPSTGKIVAGALSDDGASFINTENVMTSQYQDKRSGFTGNTTIGIVVTNANLTKAQANKVASMAHNGYGRTIRPAHSMFDGDTIFAMATGKVEVDVSVVGLLAAQVMEQAVLTAIKNTDSLHGFKCYREVCG